MNGKAMIICLKRRSCVELCDESVGLCPQWHVPVVPEAASQKELQPYRETAAALARRRRSAKGNQNRDDQLRPRPFWLAGTCGRRTLAPSS